MNTNFDITANNGTAAHVGTAGLTTKPNQVSAKGFNDGIKNDNQLGDNQMTMATIKNTPNLFHNSLIPNHTLPNFCFKSVILVHSPRLVYL